MPRPRHSCYSGLNVLDISHNDHNDCSSLPLKLFVLNNNNTKLTSCLLLSKGWTIAKCICECNKSGRRVVFEPEAVAMSTSFCASCVFLQPERVVSFSCVES